MKKLIWGCQNWYPVTCTNFDPLKPILNGLLSQKTHTTCFPSRHIPKRCVFGSAVTPFYHTLFLMNPLHVELKTRTHFLFKKHTFQVVHIWVYWTIDYYTFFNVILILKRPGMTFTSSYLDILNLRSHLISSKSVSPTLKTDRHPKILWPQTTSVTYDDYGVKPWHYPTVTLYVLPTLDEWI